MDRQFELRDALPADDWKQYNRGKPVFSRSGEYLGRDVADPLGVPWRQYLATLGIGGFVLAHPLIAEINPILAIFATGGVIVAPHIHEKLEGKLTTDKKIFDPQI